MLEIYGKKKFMRIIVIHISVIDCGQLSKNPWMITAYRRLSKPEITEPRIMLLCVHIILRITVLLLHDLTNREFIGLIPHTSLILYDVHRTFVCFRWRFAQNDIFAVC